MDIGFPTHLCLCAVDMGLSACLWSVQWTWDLLCACDLCSRHGACCMPVICAVDMAHAACLWFVQCWADVFKLQKFRASAFLITGRKRSIVNWRPLELAIHGNARRILRSSCHRHVRMWEAGTAGSYLPDYMCYTLGCLDFWILICWWQDLYFGRKRIV